MPHNRLIYPHQWYRLGSTRRRFLKGSAAAIAGFTLANCQASISNTPEELTTAPTDSSDPTAKTLNIYTWADYRNDELAKAFTAETGIDVVVDIYDSNETMLAKLQAGGGDAYSIIYPSDYMVLQMIELGLLAPMEPDRIKGLENLLDKWVSPAYDPDNQFSVPFAWGTTGLLYNKEIIKDMPDDWAYLWDNKETLSKRITLLDDVRETMGATLRSLGYSYNSTEPKELEEAYNRLVELKPHIASFMSFGYEDALLGGDLAMVMAFSVDAIAATLEDERMEYVIPKSGSSVWTDTMVIPASAPNKEAAYAWINYNLDPAVSQKNTEMLSSATPNKIAFENLPEDIKSNTDLFPPPEVLERCEGIAPVGEATELLDEYWTKITSA